MHWTCRTRPHNKEDTKAVPWQKAITRRHPPTSPSVYCTWSRGQRRSASAYGDTARHQQRCWYNSRGISSLLTFNLRRRESLCWRHTGANIWRGGKSQMSLDTTPPPSSFWGAIDKGGRITILAIKHSICILHVCSAGISPAVVYELSRTCKANLPLRIYQPRYLPPNPAPAKRFNFCPKPENSLSRRRSRRCSCCVQSHIHFLCYERELGENYFGS